MTQAADHLARKGLWPLFAAQADASAKAPALLAGDRAITYAELRTRAEGLAARLVTLGVGRGDYVGLLASRGADTVIAMLAVLRAGAAYVPLDPSHAPEQLPFIARDLPLAAVLVAPAHAERANTVLPKGVPTLPLESGGAAGPLPAFPAVSGEDPAYVMYTSGTTGTPKGVVVPQRAVVGIAVAQDLIDPGPGDRLLHAATIAADGSAFEIWGALLNGAACAVVEEAHPGLDRIAAVMRRHKVTMTLWYAGLHHLMIDHQIGAFETVRTSMSGGDTVSPAHMLRLLQAWPALKLRNLFGPTETTVVSLGIELTPAMLGTGAVPIGRPLRGQEAFVVDDDLHPLPPGTVGQLVLAGQGVAQGYHGQPGKTAAVFIADPRPGHDGKVYLTGDLAAEGPDGAFHFHGRADRMVKLGGRRIELDGIEHVLRADPRVNEAIVEVVPGPTGDKRIAAVLRPEGTVEDEAAFAAEVLKTVGAHLIPAELPRVTRVMADLPLTPAGKIDRATLRKTLATVAARSGAGPDTAGAARAGSDARPASSAPSLRRIRAAIAEVWDAVLGCGPLPDEASFFDAGGTSLQLIDAHAALESRLDRRFDITVMFETPRLGALAKRLAALPADKHRDKARAPASGAIALVGRAARLPGVGDDLAAFWQHLRAGDDLISHFSEGGMDDAFSPGERDQPKYVRARGVVEGAGMFDARFFSVLPRDAARMDPQARIFLECCQSALDEAGLDPARAPGPVGVFAGSSPSTYLWHNLISDRAAADRLATDYQLADFATVTGNTPDSLATRVAYKLDLRGPAVSVSTACSTSLTAIAQACLALRAGVCDAALAGGVSITFPQKRGYMAVEGGITSADGTCRPFDTGANGTVFSQGAGVVVLKRLEDALAAGDHIHAVIRGVGMNNDGAEKMSYTAPSVTGQAQAIRMALRDAGLAPETISHVECHGTATPLGDPIEIAGLAQAFGTGSAGACALGAVKGNIGHLDAAAGVTGVIKTTLMFAAAEIPPIAHFRAPNPRIDLAATPFRLPTAPEPWQGDSPRRAGVSAFGVGGTNVHLILEEPPVRDSIARPEAPQILPLSAPSPEALAEMAARLADRLDAPGTLALPAPALPDAAFTLQEGRRRFAWRLAVSARSTSDAAAALRAAHLPPAPAPAPDVVFMFPGQGSQYPGMGKGLYATEPEYARWIDQGVEILRPLIDIDMADLLCFGDASDAAQARALRDTLRTQPALYLTQVATARLWQARGVAPAAMIGHSVGEFAAATLAGVMSFEAGLRIIAERGRLMQDQPPGAMLSVRCTPEQLQPHLGDAVDLAAMNAPKLQVVAGPGDRIAALADRLQAAGIATTRLHTSHAFHSAMMDPVTAPLEAMIAQEALLAPEIPFVSSVTGDWITETQARSPAFWAAQARAPVNFMAALQAVTGSGAPVLVEMGAGRTLSAFAGQTLKRGGHGGILQSLPDHTQTDIDDQSAMSTTVCNLWAAGVHIDWSSLPRGNRKVPLPGYAFQRTRHWVDPPEATKTATVPEIATPVPAAALPAPAAHPTVPTTPQPVILPATLPAAITRPAMSITEPAAAPRKDRLTSELTALFSDLSGEDLGPDDTGVPFLELGFDSLFMGQVAQALGRDYGVDMTFRSLLSDTPSISALARHLDAILPPEAIPAPQAVAPQVATTVPAAPPASAATVPLFGPIPLAASPDMAELMQAQMQTMQAVFAEQLRTLGAAPSESATAPSVPAPVAWPEQVPATPPAPAATQATPTLEAAPASEGFKTGRGPSLAGAELTPPQRAFVTDFATRYAQKHAKSKTHTADHRPHLADPRTASGFHPDWKELVFPLVIERSKGPSLWDIDGNHFIDLVNGFGQTAFGHSPDFVSAAVAQQMEHGYAIGPQSGLAGPLAARLSAMLGHDRVTFCNTGSEAVMAAMRIARTVTGRDRIVVFGNDYHGQFDEVLVKGRTRGGAPTALPIAPGIPRSALANMTVLPYGTDDSLDWIRANMNEIAAVIVEPVQSRHPELRPVEFVRALREITAKGGAAFVMDEVVTGFRTHARGMQGLWDITPDMATYGKVVGGGLPIGLLAGSPRFMDALDGGQWAYGDASLPQVAPTFFAGTFVRHPLVLAAVKAVLDHLDTRGGELWNALPERTAALAARMNAALAARGVPPLVTQFSSWFVINVTLRDPRASLLYPLMRMEGVHVLDGFCGFLTTAHSEADMEQIARAFETALDALQSIGILAGDATAVAPPGTPALKAPTSAIPLTESQHEIWLTHQLGDSAACSFNEGAMLRLNGALDRAALAGALTDVVARHDALRLVFDRAGAHFDVVEPYAPEITFHDVSAKADPEAALQALLVQDAATPFDLTAAPALRVMLARLGADAHMLVLTAHHILCDGWSFNVIFDDLAQLYTARSGGLTTTLTPAPSFAAFAQGQANQGTNAETIAFWRAQYDTIPALPDLPTDRVRPAIKEFGGGTVTATISPDEMKAIRKAGAKAGCTLFATLFAGLQMTLGRLSGASDVVIGVPTAAQAALPNPALVGHAVNFLPIRAPFDPARPAAEHLAAVSRAVMDAFDHSDTTYGALVRELQVPRTLGRLPLTEVQFNLEKVGEGLRFGAMTASPVPAPKAASNFDLFFNVIEGRNGLRIDVNYNADVHDAETAHRWVGHYAALLKGLADDTAQPVNRLPLMTPGALTQLIEGPNSTTADYDHAAMLQDLIAHSAATHPDAVAVEAADATLTYAALATRSDALAAHVQAAVPGTGARIAVALPRGAGMVVGLLAVLKAGHSYVPLDPRQPTERLRTICETAEVAAILADKAPFAGDIPVIRPVTAKDGAAPAPVPADPGRAAYVIFTSGSTGTPKGVAVPHRAVVNFLASMAREPGLSEKDTLLAVTTVMFDIAVLELFGPLVVGGRVVIAGTDDVLDGFALARRASAPDITVMQATPTLWDMLMEAGFAPRPGLKMLAGGEPLPADLARRLSAGGALWNMYGPTETTIWSAAKQITDGDITIGHPIANTALHILSDADQPQPVGVPGELNIGGDGLALGYFGRDDLTAAAFREVDIGDRRHKLYRTGDLAFRRADGEVVVLGRRDTQVKLRGFRIELGEIETRLRALPGVAKAAVDVTTRPGGDRLLAAWLVATPGTTPATAALSAALAAQLPDYMVPQVWTVMEALPQTANGKLDRKALSAPATGPQSAPAPAAEARAAPMTPQEARIAEIWAKVLGRDIGPDDNLHALGIDSLSVFRIAARMLDAGLGLQARDMLAHPTVRALAAFARTQGDTGTAPQRPSLKSFRGGARRDGLKAS